MLDELRQLAIFAKTVEHNSFRGAARALNISPSVVSHHIAQLEERLGTTLLYRSTRNISITEDGKRLLKHAQTLVNSAEAGLEELSTQGDVLSGFLRIGMPAILAQSIVIDRIVAFIKEHPKIRLEFDFSDSIKDPIGERFDLVIRMGNVRNSALKKRKLNEFQRILVASPDYIVEKPAIRDPEDLEKLDWIALADVHFKHRMRHSRKAPVTLKPQSPHMANDALAICQMARAGAGLAVLPDCLVAEDISEGRLLQVLPKWQLDPISVYVLWPRNAARSGLAVRLVDHLAKFAPKRL